jgi:predicted GNAT family acetyltransferase
LTANPGSRASFRESANAKQSEIRAVQSAHNLDRPVWSALTTRQAHLALGDARAVRMAPAYGLFAAAADESPASLAALSALVPPDGQIALVETGDIPRLAGAVVTAQAQCHQMVATRLAPAESDFAIVPLDEADAPEMLALATLTKPGPFFARTHALGDFVGVKQDGRLVAMAGERMRPVGFTEVSGVCTHPDYRGRGYAAGLIRAVAGKICARGETPFLHAYSSHTETIALYERLGFTLRRLVTITVLGRALQAGEI